MLAPKNKPWALGGSFAVCLATVLWISTGAAGVLYLPLYALATLPGLPLGFALFGRRHAAGWIGGALLGYGLTARSRTSWGSSPCHRAIPTWRRGR